jgi:phosphoglycolate phosphatase-like HAD superfamily hydrolase
MKEKKIRCVIFDFDGTLFGETIFPHAEILLRQIHELNIKQALATFNPHIKFYCERYGIGKYFEKVYYGRCKDFKLSYVKQIIHHYNITGYGLQEEECLFIDDNPDNIREVSKATKVTCIKVEPKEGIQREQLEIYLKLP